MSESDVIIVNDPHTKARYLRGRFLGKGGFARCYEFKNVVTNQVVAGKVVSKSGLVKPQHRSKMSQEISIHRSLNHPYVVKFYSHFEDELNIYIMLELCRKRSLMEMHKRRKALTVQEVRYFMRQITLACQYLHGEKIIHRDLKLGNLFLNDDMDIKVGDFGLATKLLYEGERKKTLCGTPNYIAPEILNKAGHSYEVDLWSLGCIMYTLLVGVPPFETRSLEATYKKISKNEYNIPKTLDEDAKDLIIKLLNPRAEKRPNPTKILEHSFFVNQPILRKLPTACLTMAPRQSAIPQRRPNASPRKPLVENNLQLLTIQENNVGVTQTAQSKRRRPEQTNQENLEDKPNQAPSDFYLSDLLKQLVSVVDSRPDTRFTGQDEDAQDPSLVPFVWVSKWIDYSDKYGLGYCLCDNSKGVSFSDNTHIMLLADDQSLHYKDKAKKESYFTVQTVPEELLKKKKLLDFFITYMTENLSRAGESATPREADEMTQVPTLRKWIRTNTSIMFHLTNGTVQINFLNDHTKIIMCPIMGAVSYINEKKDFTVYNLKAIERHGCSKALAHRMRFAVSMIEKYLMPSVPKAAARRP